jgi:uncharacterized protein YnzC (UPF0291/DUF896 family)
MLGACTMNLSTVKTTPSYVPSASEYQAQARPAIRDDDLLRAKEKGLATDDMYTNEYMEMQSLYRMALDEYLVAKLDLAAINEHLATSPLGFGAVSVNEGNVAQRSSTMDLPYVYLGNNLYIERLSDSDLAILRQGLAVNDSISDATRSLVERTYRDVICVLYSDGKPSEGYDVIYPDGTKALSGSLIIVVNDPMKFDKAGALADDNWQERQDYLKNYLASAHSEMEKKLDNSVTIFLMDYSTVLDVIE